MKQDGDRPRRKWPWVVLGIVLAMLVPASWMLAHRLASRTLPAPPWTDADLPAIPDPVENGLDDVVLPGAWTLTSVDTAMSDLVGPLEGDSPDARWAEIAQRASQLRAWLDADRELRSLELARVDAVLAAPRFADPCSIVGTDCRMIQLVNLARFAMLADLVAALDGAWLGAFARANAMLAASNDLVATARTTLANAVALVFARLVADHLRVLVAAYRTESTAGSARTELSELRPTLAATETALDALARADVSARRAVIAESLWLRGGLMPILEDPGSHGGPAGPLVPYMLDVHGTVATVDEHFVAVMRWVEAPDHATRPPPPTREYASGPGWWLWNPGGKMILDIGGVDSRRSWSAWMSALTTSSRHARLFASSSERCCSSPGRTVGSSGRASVVRARSQPHRRIHHPMEDPMRTTTTMTFLLTALLAACGSDPVATTDAGRTDDAGSDAGDPMADAGNDAGPGDDAGPDDAGFLPERHIALTIGTLGGTPTDYQPMHDAIAGGGEAGARGAGNLHHEVFLGTALLGTEVNQFLATDRWTNLEGARAVYSNPDFIAAFSTLFAAPTAPVLYTRTDWHQWGDLDAADGSTPRYFAVVRGTLASTDLAAMQAIHDAAASGGETMVTAAGDVAHIVFLGADDPTQFLAIDVWTSDAAIVAVYSDPAFVASLAGLFSAPPTFGVYESTSWHQW